MNQFLRRNIKRTEWVGEISQEFAHEHPDLLVIVADPDTDAIFVSYGDKATFGKVKNRIGMKLGVVKAVLRRSTFKSKIDQFLISLAETLWVPLKHHVVNHFFQFIDGALYNISRALDKNHQSQTMEPKASKPSHNHAKETSGR